MEYQLVAPSITGYQIVTSDKAETFRDMSTLTKKTESITSDPNLPYGAILKNTHTDKYTVGKAEVYTKKINKYEFDVHYIVRETDKRINKSQDNQRTKTDTTTTNITGHYVVHYAKINRK